MNKLTVSRDQYEQLMKALRECNESKMPDDVKAAVFNAAASGIIGKEVVAGVLANGGKVDELVIVDRDKQTSVRRESGRVVVMEMRQS